jgi:hypothetical protein
VRLLALAAILLSPAVAYACPACGGNGDGGIDKLVSLGAMILLPFAITGFVVRAIKNATPRG